MNLCETISDWVLTLRRRFKKPPILTSRQRALYDRLLAGEFYAWGDKRTPKTMIELQELGLVKPLGRAVTVQVFWAPAGSLPMNYEKIRP